MAVYVSGMCMHGARMRVVKCVYGSARAHTVSMRVTRDHSARRASVHMNYAVAGAAPATPSAYIVGAP